MDDWYDRTGRGGGRGLVGRDEVWNGMHDGIGWGGWLFMLVFLLLLVALVVGIVLVLLRSTGGLRSSTGAGASGGGSMASSTAQQVLDERYARGEIEEEEYLRRRSVLRGQ